MGKGIPSHDLSDGTLELKCTAVIGIAEMRAIVKSINFNPVKVPALSKPIFKVCESKSVSILKELVPRLASDRQERLGKLEEAFYVQSSFYPKFHVEFSNDPDLVRDLSE
jgi:hypothetical protein